MGAREENALLRASSPDEALIATALDGLYLPDSILATKAEPRGACALSVEFVFPEYERIAVAGDHVSAVQINAAIIEGCYCLIAHAAAQNVLPLGYDLKQFLNTRCDWLLVHQECLFRKAVRFQEAATLDFELTNSRRQILRRRFLRLDFAITGFVSASQSWLLNLDLIK